MAKELLVERALFFLLGFILNLFVLLLRTETSKRFCIRSVLGTFLKDCYPLATVNSILNMFIFA